MDEDLPLLNTPNLVALILREAEARGVTAERCADRLARLFARGGDALPVDRDTLVARCATHIGWLRTAGLVAAGDGDWVLTARGRGALEEHPAGMDLAELAAYPEFADWLEAQEASGGRKPAEARADGYDEGFEARRAGRPFTDNPYSFASAGHLAWENGWCEALDEEEGPGTSPLTGSRRDAN